MKLQQSVSLIEISKIKVLRDQRQREPGKEALEVAWLQKSIAQHGLLSPILISDDFILQAGERRLTACRNLGWEKILARKISQLTPVEQQLIEFVENAHREDLCWQDTVRAVGGMHKLQLQLDPDWTMGETAAQCAMELSHVSLLISVYKEMENERVASAGTAREAYNMLKRRENRNAGAELEALLSGEDIPAETEPEQVATGLSEADQARAVELKKLGEPLPPELRAPPVIRQSKPAPKPDPESILNISFLDWAPQYSGPKFNFIHCDFPYGVELFSGPQGRGAELGQNGKLGYKDSVDVYQTLIKSLCTNLDRVMSVSAHMMFWLSADYRIISNTVALFNELAPSLQFAKFPLIWFKNDNAGIASDPKRGARHVYEACLLASRGNRNIARVKGDAYSAPTDKKLHPSTKPEPMLRHFMEMLVDDTTIMLDPTCGSGASLRAAESLGASHVLGLEIDKQYVDPARLALKQARMKRAAERTGGSLGL